MTKLFSIIAVAVIATSLVSCGPSAEEKAKMEETAKRAADSIEAAIAASLQGAVETATDAAVATASDAATTAVETATAAAEAAVKH
jgi:hypothetical protein